MILAPLVAAALVALLLARPWEDVPPLLGPVDPPEHIRSLSIDFGIVTDPATDWSVVNDRLDEVAATSVDLNAGRVEFTGFDWEAYPDAAAEPGRDHIARAARALRTMADGSPRQIGLVVDAYVPEWIRQDPSVAGKDAAGQPGPYQPSATALTDGPVGQRLVEYVAALGERYGPSQITITELFLDRYSYGDDDLALYREMTGATDWPRGADGQIDEGAPELGTWRSEVLASLLARMRTALDEVRDGEGKQIELAMDVRVNWADLASGDASSGHDFEILLRSVDRLVVWAYIGVLQRSVDEVGALTAALAASDIDSDRITVSVGLWGPDGVQPIPVETMAEAVTLAGTNGIRAVHVTPYSLMSEPYWTALAGIWVPQAEAEGD
ncbi:hypothetical protein [Sanguibacter suarezii]|uniref:hypothetical protein n=1 Tax=Sanguibacter suarezii TaxID=60921 RepID=UPI000A85E204|nr:hypothetical protein [Sanguibacter suarezii]